MKLLQVALLGCTAAVASVLVTDQKPLHAPAPISIPSGISLDDSTDDWWLQQTDFLKTTFQDTIDTIEAVVDATVSATSKLRNKVLTELRDISRENQHLFIHGDGNEPQTIYDFITNSPQTTIVAKFVADSEYLTNLLNSTNDLHTLFVPTDEAFRHLPKHDDLPKEVITSLIEYHIAPGKYEAKKVFSSYTVPTLRKEKTMGGEAQRLRPSISWKGAKLNFYSSIIGVDIAASNGVIHVIDKILLPPPVVGVIISILPSRFSSLLLAYEKTEFVKFVHGQKMSGATMFAPSNKAFEALGVKANAFLFNTQSGLQHLLALLKYQIVANVTLYSDAIYDHRESKGKLRTAEHHDLPTLLPDAHIGVDTAKFLGLTLIRVNGFIDVAVHDVIAKNGVIHQVDRLPLPPRKRTKGFVNTRGGEISVEELKDRLADYL